jgi:predicted RNA-binding Zn-ribbon protein involved in translation (DUF1610 family)
MITEIKNFMVNCDGCGKKHQYDSYEDNYPFKREMGWKTVITISEDISHRTENHYCPECLENMYIRQKQREIGQSTIYRVR